VNSVKDNLQRALRDKAMSAAKNVFTAMDNLLIDRSISVRNVIKILQMDYFPFFASLSNKINY
jgi:hypothetical protein